jgi:TfoX/Sxy family transcriptional regulator of competence genes
MAYDEKLAERVRKRLHGYKGLTERKMFGGVGFMLLGNMCCGISNDELILRLGPEQTQLALKRAHTRVFDMTGKVMKGWIMVAREGCRTDKALKDWLEQDVRFALTLPAKN